jgi:hypothetical protein
MNAFDSVAAQLRTEVVDGDEEHVGLCISESGGKT